MNEREKFERHIDECIVSAEGLDEAIKKDGENYYIPWVQGKWLAWQAAKTDSAAEIADLRRQLDDCAIYLKPGETPRERMDRDAGDTTALMKLFEAEKRTTETLRRELEGARKDADNYWNDDDRERNYSSISEFLNDKICNGTPIEVGSTFTLLRAVSLPKITIRVTSVDEEECEADYEIVGAAIDAAMKEQK